MTPFEFDMALQRPVFYMMNRGIKVDLEKREELSQQKHADWEKYQGFLNEIAGRPVNVNSPKQMKEFLYGTLGLPPRSKSKKVTTNEDAVRASMAYAADKHASSSRSDTVQKWQRAFLGCRLILLVRGVRKQLSSYLDVALDDDGRARCTISVGGTETMRFSHSKTLWNTGLNLATVPHSLRVMFVADEGMELAEFDLNRGESWVYTYLSMDPELIRIHEGGLDFHAETAAAIQSAFGGKGLSAEDIRRLAKEGDPFGYKIRYLGKKVNHACAYRMGPFRAAEVVNEEADDTGITVVPAQMRTAQRLWGAKYVGLQSTWWPSIDNQISNERRLITPYGRVRNFYGALTENLFKEATAYVPQSTSVDYLNRGMLRVFDQLIEVDRADLKIELLHQNHDSILIQYPRDNRAEVHRRVKQCLRGKVVIGNVEVTIPVEGSAGQNWGDYHKERNPGGLKEVA